MAITRAQQAKQMLRNGGMSLQEAKDMAPKGEFLAYINAKEAKMLKDAGGSGIMTKAGIPSFIEYDDPSGSGFESAKSTGSVRGDVDRGRNGGGNNKVDVGFQEALRKQNIEKKKKEARDDGDFRTTGSVKYSPPTFFQSLKNKSYQSAIDRNKYLALQKAGLIPGGGFKGFAGSLIDGFFGKVPENLQDLTEEELTELAFEVQKFKDAGGPINQATYNYNLNPTKKGSGLELLGRTFDAQDLLDSGQMTQTKFEELFPGQDIPEDRDGPQDPCLGPNPPAYCFVGIRSAVPEKKEEETFTPNLRLMAEGGRIGFFKGAQADASAGRGAMSPGTDTGGGFRGGRDDGPKGPPKEPPKGPTGGGGKGPETFQMVNPTFKKSLFEDELRLENFIKKMELENRLKEDEKNQEDVNYPTSGIFLDPKLDEKKKAEIFQEFKANGGRAGLAEGGMPYEGGIMDLESARQMYGLGKLVKKVTRSVKKIAKSPLGKAAIGAALFKFGSPLFAKGGKFNPFFFAGKDPSFGALTMKGALTGITGISALAGLTAEEDDTDQEQYTQADLPFPVDYYLSGQYAPNVRLAAEGGLMRAGYQEGSKEPVAKKTMPLLDMGGMEKDYREEGGFVPIGRMEKADDVPARLSKNEFVFTADAVRNAGDGDVDLGAEKMYNMMKNLEAGGDVSEESQGMDGARKMFQTSQRLEEVI